MNSETITRYEIHELQGTNYIIILMSRLSFKSLTNDLNRFSTSTETEQLTILSIFFSPWNLISSDL